MLDPLIKSSVAYVIQGNSYLRDAWQAEGFYTFQAYKDNGMITRILREASFRIGGLFEEIWYNKRIIDNNPTYLIIRDTQITKRFLQWLQKSLPKSKVFYLYGNMVGKAAHILPNDLPDGIVAWTYDAYDAATYGLNLRSIQEYHLGNVKKKKPTKYDVLFVGRDKGRGEELCHLENKLQDLGLRTKFVITADGRLSKKKPFYSEPVSYDQITEWLAESRAVLNYTMDNQQGITLRDIESIFNGIKLITTNSEIIKSPIYDAQNVFILGRDAIDNLPSFLSTPVNKRSDIISLYSYDAAVEEIIGV